MDNNEDYTFKNVRKFSSNNENNFKNFKKLTIPFIAGMLGSCLVMAVCFNTLNTAFLDTPASTSPISTNSRNSNIDNIINSNAASTLDIGSDVAKKVLPSVVGVEVQYVVNSVFGGQGTAKASGSGIVMTSDGYILTNNHVISSSSTNSFYQVSEASKVTVYLYNDATPYEAKIIGSDKLIDLAVIKIEKNNLKPAVIGNSDELKIGQFAMAVR